MDTMRVAYLCRFVPIWRIPQLRSIVGSDGKLVLNVVAVNTNGTHKHQGVQAYHEQGLSVEVLQSVSVVVDSAGRSSPWYFTPSLALRLVQLRPDVILMEGGSNLPNNLIGFIYSIATSTPIVWWSLGSIPGRKYSTLGQVFRQVVACLERHCDALVGYSSRAVRYFRSIGISEQKCFRAVNVVDVDSIMAEINDVMAYRHESRADLGFKSDEPVLIFVGSLNPAKKAHLLPIILRRVRSVHRNTTMTVIGDGPSLAAVKLAAEEQGMTPFIRFTGAMSEGVGQHFAAADVMILPGLGGLAIGQSLAYGTPVICSVADGTEEDLIDNPFSGIVLESCEDESFLAENFSCAVISQLKFNDENPNFSLHAQQLLESRHTLKAYSKSIRVALFSAYSNS